MLLAAAQKGIGSLNDPCDCMQHHDFWVATRRGLMDIFWTPDYPLRVLDPEDQLHYSTRRQSCLYSPENEESHRPTALSDCIPGFILVHIVCMQRHLANRNPERAMDFATELVRLLPFGAACLDKAGWPINSAQVLGYYRRFRRAFAAGPRGPMLSQWDAVERGDRTAERERALETGSLVSDDWPTWLLREMFWQVGSEPYAEKQLGEEPDVCPAGTFPEGGACWLLGKTGASCQEACDDAGMQLNLRDQTRQPDLGTLEHPRLDLFHEPHVPHIVAAQSGHRPLLDIQHPWAPFECFVPEESRFHLAATWLEQDPAWSYPICALACPCIPVPGLQEILEAIPFWPES